MKRFLSFITTLIIQASKSNTINKYAFPDLTPAPIPEKPSENTTFLVKRKVAIVIGHSSTSRGARNISANVTEWEYNTKIAKRIAMALNISGKIDPVLVYRENGYAKLPGEINKLNVDLIIALHCNAFNGMASGCEMLYYHKSKSSKKFAEIAQTKMVAALRNRNRGIASKTSEDLGGYLLKETNSTCIITEPFFIDNNKEFENAIDKETQVIGAYVDAITIYLEEAK